MDTRRILILGLVVALAGLTAFTAFGDSAPAQSNLEDRVAALETEVAEQGEDIVDLRQRVRDLEGIVNAEETADAGSEGKDGSAGIEISGNGETVSDPIHLDAGSYRVTANVDAQSVFGGDGFAVVAYADGEYLDLIFNELIDENGPWSGSQVLQVPSSADVYFEVTNTSSDWTLTISPL